MIPELLSFFSLLISTTIAFFTSALIVHFSINLFKIRNYRLRYLLRLIPFLGVILDVIAFEYRLGNWLNPLSCNSCVQKVLLSLFFPDLQSFLESNQISLIRHLSQNIPQLFDLAVLCAILFMTSVIFIRRIFQIILSNMQVKSIIAEGQNFSKPIVDDTLRSKIICEGTRILVSNKIMIPMATHLNTIVFPSILIDQLSQEEFEAVLAHEFEHIQWKDPLIKAIYMTFSSVLWWMPMRFWLQKMEQEQELGCDQNAVKYTFSEEFLASALIKAATLSKQKPFMTVCCLVKKENFGYSRLKAMLNRYPKEEFTILGGIFVIIVVIILIICSSI